MADKTDTAALIELLVSVDEETRLRVCRWINQNRYHRDEVETIIKQVLALAAESAVTFLPSHSHLHGVKAVDKQSITSIDYSHLLNK